MIRRPIATAVLAVVLCGAGVPAQAAEGSDTPASAAPKPAADTKDPGKTATEAVTNPSVAPAAKGPNGIGVSPDGGSSKGHPTPSSSPAR
jgi:hypothetical protein